MPASVGSLERPVALRAFFTALAKLEDPANARRDDVRIVHIGDSHTAADWQTGPIRRQLQARFGDGGRGFVPIGRPWKAWSQEGLLTNQAGDWTTALNHPASRRATGDGYFGLAGYAMASRQGGARAWTEVLAASSRAELDWLAQPGGGSFDAIVDGTRTRISTRSDERHAAYRSFELSAAAQHHLEIQPLGDGEVRLLGVALDRTEPGVVYDALGINGARVATALSWNEALWSEELRHRAPALVVVAYGTNDAVDVETSLDAFARGLAELLARITRAIAGSSSESSSGSCLVLGPPDRGTAPRLGEIVGRARKAAAVAGCAFYDQVAAMGGLGSMERWAKEAYPRGQPDRVHFTREGYAQLGSAFVSDTLRAYDLWKTKAVRASD